MYWNTLIIHPTEMYGEIKQPVLKVFEVVNSNR